MDGEFVVVGVVGVESATRVTLVVTLKTRKRRTLLCGVYQLSEIELSSWIVLLDSWFEYLVVIGVVGLESVIIVTQVVGCAQPYLTVT